MCDANSNSYLITQSAFQALDIIQYIVQFIIAFGYLFQFDFILPIIFVISVIPCTIAELKQVEAVYGFRDII